MVAIAPKVVKITTVDVRKSTGFVLLSVDVLLVWMGRYNFQKKKYRLSISHVLGKRTKSLSTTNGTLSGERRKSKKSFIKLIRKAKLLYLK